MGNEGSFSSDLKLSISQKTKTRIPNPPGKLNLITKVVPKKFCKQRHQSIGKMLNHAFLIIAKNVGKVTRDFQEFLAEQFFLKDVNSLLFNDREEAVFTTYYVT